MSWDLPIRKSKAHKPTPTLPERKEWEGLGDITLVPVADVIVPDDQPEPDPVLVADIAESM